MAAEPVGLVGVVVAARKASRGCVGKTDTDVVSDETAAAAGTDGQIPGIAISMSH